MTEAAPPWHLRVVQGILRRLPRGQYGLLAIAADGGLFEARLARDVGGARFQCDLVDQIANPISRGRARASSRSAARAASTRTCACDGSSTPARRLDD
jgi:hypothetical protein